MMVNPTINFIEQKRNNGTGYNYFLHVVSSFPTSSFEAASHDPISWEPVNGKYQMTVRVQGSTQLPDGICYTESYPIIHSIYFATEPAFNRNSEVEYLQVVVRDITGEELGVAELHKTGITSQDEPTEDSKPIPLS